MTGILLSDLANVPMISLQNEKHEVVWHAP